MAIIKVQAPVAGIRGTIGGITYSANKAGPYAKAWSRGSNPKTDFQTAQRRTLSTIPALWNALNGAEQLAWDTFAALPAQDRTNPLGETFSASGYNWFTICNTRLINMGRPPITATPIIARPASPTISTLQLPFLENQIAKITYPSGEWTPTQDQVIEIGVVNSTGRTVAPNTLLQLLLDQDPPDTDQVFRVPYLDRWNLVGPAYKGFARAYRQTTEGIRSAPGTASFISTDSSPYVATADDYDGTTNYALRGSDLTGDVDSKVFTSSIWFRIDGGNGTLRNLVRNSGARFRFGLTTINTFEISCSDPSGTNILRAFSLSTFTSGPNWHNVILSVDLAAAKVQIVVNGTSETPNITVGPIDALIDFTNADWAYGAATAGSGKFDGCISDTYLTNTETLDMTNANNIAAFISQAGEPVDLGNDGSFPTGTQPIIAVLGGDPSINIGSGGNFVNQAGLNACSSSP